MSYKLSIVFEFLPFSISNQASVKIKDNQCLYVSGPKNPVFVRRFPRYEIQMRDPLRINVITLTQA